MNTKGSFLWVKRPGHEADHSPSSNAKVIMLSFTLARGFESRQGRESFSYASCPDRLWGSTSLLFSEYQELFDWG